MSKPHLTDLNLFAMEYIALNMRDCDQKELFGIWPHDAALTWAYEVTYLLRNKGRAKIAYVDGKPAAVFGFTESRPGVWDVWMCGTDDFNKAIFTLMRWCRKEANDILTHCKGHRLQAQSRAEHTEAHKLIRAMGGVEECRLRRYGKDQSDYLVFVWLDGENDAILKPHYVQQKELH